MLNFTVIVGAILADNLLFSHFFGIETVFTETEKKRQSVIYGAFVCIVTVLSGCISSFLNIFVFVPLNMEYIITFAAAVTVLIVICLVHIISEKLSKGIFESYTKYMPIISTNCVTVISSLNAYKAGLSLKESALYAVACGVGFLLAVSIFSCIRDALDSSEPPKAFKGLPILLLSCAFAAMALKGFTGIGM